MAKESFDSETEPERGEDTEEAENGRNEGISEYEKKRLSRIAENKARMESLGLHNMAYALMPRQKSGRTPKRSSSGRKGKRKFDDTEEDDDDYRPEGDCVDSDTDDEEFADPKSSSKSNSKNKVKKKSAKSTKKVSVQNQFSGRECGGDGDDDDEELMQAIALSLQDSAKDTALKERKGNAPVQEESNTRKRKKSFSSRVQMTEDEVVLHFFGFDETGNGTMTVRDLQRVATAHDFLWEDEELADMVRYFDSDGDGKLNLDDFRKIASRCNMIPGSET